LRYFFNACVNALIMHH